MSDNPTLHYTSPNLNLAFNMHPCLHGGEGHPKHLDKSVKSSQHQLNFSTSHISKENTVKLPPEFTRNLLQYLNLTNPNVSFWECFRDSCPWKLHFFHEPWVISTCVFVHWTPCKSSWDLFGCRSYSGKFMKIPYLHLPVPFFFGGGGVFPDLERLKKNSTVHMI